MPRDASLRAPGAGSRWALGTPPAPPAWGGRQRATLGYPKGVVGGCAPEGPVLKCRLYYLSALYSCFIEMQEARAHKVTVSGEALTWI